MYMYTYIYTYIYIYGGDHGPLIISQSANMDTCGARGGVIGMFRGLFRGPLIISL